MKKVMILLLVTGFLTACKNDSNDNKNKAQTRAKDDYLSNNTNSERKAAADDKKGWGDKENKQNWSASDKKNFMDECVGEASKKVSAARANQYCDCMLQKFITIYPSLNDLNLDQSSAAKARMDRLIKECK